MDFNINIINCNWHTDKRRTIMICKLFQFQPEIANNILSNNFQWNVYNNRDFDDTEIMRILNVIIWKLISYLFTYDVRILYPKSLPKSVLQVKILFNIKFRS